MKRIFSLLIFSGLTSSLFGQVIKSSNRIVTVGSVLTEIICELGHCDEIVATDRTSVYPVKMNSLPSVGYRTGINAEGILSQNPTLIFLTEKYIREELPDQLRSSGVHVHLFPGPYSIEATKKLILEVGKILKEESKAKDLISRMEKELEETNALLKQTTTRPKVIFIYARGEGTQMVAGKETFTENLILMAGGTPVADITGFKPINTEAMIVSNPDFLLFGDTGLESLGGIDGALQIQGVDQTTAGKKRNIIEMEMVMMSNFGPRLPQAVRELMLKIHPEIKI